MTEDPVGVVDTNIIILLQRLRAQDLPAEPVISAITLPNCRSGRS